MGDLTVNVTPWNTAWSEPGTASKETPDQSQRIDDFAKTAFKIK